MPNHAVLLSALALLAGAASAQRPMAKGRAPAALSDDERCPDGSCDAAYDNYGGEDEFDPKETLLEETLDWPLPRFHEHASRTVRPIPAEPLHEVITRPLGFVHKHMERALIQRNFPEALSYTMSKAGNYSDGTPAGTSQWIGDVGAQDENSPTYVSFGSVLDISTHAATAKTLEWMASLVHRKEMVANRDEAYPRPCRTDLIDDHDQPPQQGFVEPCLIGATLDDFVRVRPDEGSAKSDILLAAEYGIADKGRFYVHTDWIEGEFVPGRKFDTIFTDGILAPTTDEEGPELHDMDLVIEKLVLYLKPGGTLYLIGAGPSEWTEDFAGQPGEVYHDVMEVYNAITGLAGEYPAKNLPADWVHRTVDRLGLSVMSSTQFRTFESFDDIREKITEANDMLHEIEVADDVKRSLVHVLMECLGRAEEATEHGPLYAGSQGYIIAAGLPSSPSESLPEVEEPTHYRPKPPYKKDQGPTIEKLALPDLKPGVLETFKWANGDDYDGMGARIGLPPHLPETIRDYVKKLGIWDIMTDTIYNDPMPLNTTRYYNVTSPYGNGERNFTWSAKRPDNFYGSDSDMHWFDIADEAAHEDSLRALAKGGFDEVLKAIGTYLGLDHLVTFSIGLLAVTKADKGYIHVDFSDSDKRAFNFLINLQTPECSGSEDNCDPDHTELSVIEEDEVGNRRRGQVKYSENFGVLNGDDAMHATNECNHRGIKGVRITASIFISELQEASLEQVAEHDKYYFPFGNMDWIWAQRGRHWNKDGTASLVNDKGRQPFVAKDELEGCEERVGENKEKCLVHGPERMLCYATCGFFMSEEDFRPGEDRKTVFGW